MCMLVYGNGMTPYAILCANTRAYVTRFYWSNQSIKNSNRRFPYEKNENPDWPNLCESHFNIEWKANQKAYKSEVKW